jgi:carbon-monoxide dehydrogenase medium subunit
MRPARFSLCKPTTVRDAIDLLHDNEDSKVLAGGQSLIPLMKLRLASPSLIISLQDVRELQPEIREEPAGSIRIGALTIYDEIHHSKIIQNKVPLLSLAASKISDQQVRNRGTIGGNIAHADTLANLALALLCLDAKINIRCPNDQTRTVSISDFFVDLFTTTMQHDEIIVDVEIPYDSDAKRKKGMTFVEVVKTPATWPLASVALKAEAEKRDSTVLNARIALGGAFNIPTRAFKGEQFLIGKRIDDQSIIETAAKIATENISPPSDIHGTSEYKKNLFNVLVKRGIDEIRSQMVISV